MTVIGTITGDCRFIFLLSWTIKQHVTREASFFMIKETPHFRRCLLPHLININPVNISIQILVGNKLFRLIQITSLCLS